jgi:hypothetical protein
LLRDPARARALAENGRSHIGHGFDPAVMCERYEAYFASLLHQDVRPEVRTMLKQETSRVA